MHSKSLVGASTKRKNSNPPLPQVPALVCVGFVEHVGPIGPTAAALWLFFNWWLY